MFRAIKKLLKLFGQNLRVFVSLCETKTALRGVLRGGGGALFMFVCMGGGDVEDFNVSLNLRS